MIKWLVYLKELAKMSQISTSVLVYAASSKYELVSPSTK